MKTHSCALTCMSNDRCQQAVLDHCQVGDQFRCEGCKGCKGCGGSGPRVTCGVMYQSLPFGRSDWSKGRAGAQKRRQSWKPLRPHKALSMPVGQYPWQSGPAAAHLGRFRTCAKTSDAPIVVQSHYRPESPHPHVH